MAIAAIHTQILLPKKSGGRVPAAELFMVGYGARNCIRRNALQHLHQEITMTKKKGSFTLEESLAVLVRNGDIDREEAQLRAIHPDDLDILLKPAAAAARAWPNPIARRMELGEPPAELDLAREGQISSNKQGKIEPLLGVKFIADR